MQPRSIASHLRNLAPYALIAVVALGAHLPLARSGFAGISGDDPARSLIAWEFARHPTLDPTRSSWLPVHSYLMGAAMALTHELRATSRGASIAGLLACAWLAVALARQFGADRVTATLGAFSALAFPWSIFCGWAPSVPELPGAAFLLGTVLILERTPDERLSVPRALIAGAAATVACGHRYEAWFATAGIVVSALRTWRRSPRGVLAFAVSASIVPIAWLALNHVRSGNALDFLHRVESYRALHEHLGSASSRAWRYPLLAGEHAGLLLAAAALGSRKRRSVATIAAGAVLLGLVMVDVRGGGPTHHAARALVPVVWLAAPIAAAWFSRAWRTYPAGWSRAALGVGLLAATAQCAGGLRDVPRDVDLAALRIGRALRDGHGAYFVELSREDFLWLEWASGRPQDARPDRVYGRVGPDPEALASAAAGCESAAVTSDTARAALVARGWRVTVHDGPWTLLVAPSP